MTKKMEKRLLSKLGNNIKFISSRKVGAEVLVTLEDIENGIIVERSLRHLLRRNKINHFNKKIDKSNNINSGATLLELLNELPKPVEDTKVEGQFIDKSDLKRLESSIMSKLDSITKKLENITIRVRLDNQ